MRSARLVILACTTALSLAPLSSRGADTQVLFDGRDPGKTIFPSDIFTVADETQITSRRVDLPKPDCSVRVSDCQDIEVLNQLDGFNTQPRISIPFSGPIDVTSVSSDSVFLVNLGDTRGFGSPGRKIGINQIVWDPAGNTLYVESDEFLDQHTRYAVIVTDGVRDASGDPIESESFARFRHDFNFGRTKSSALTDYREELNDAAGRSNPHGRARVVALSVFTTLSATATLEKVRRRIKAADPAPVDFNIGGGGARAVFPVGAITSILFNRQVGTAPVIATSPVPVALLNLVPGAIGHVAFGKFVSPNYQAAGEFIPAVGTRTGTPAPRGAQEIYFNLFVPAGPRPANGWPIAIFGHGFGDSKQGAPFVVAAKMAQQGIATIAINVVGHGGGALGTLTINTTGGPTSLPAGGRGIDQNGDARIDGTEGSSAAPPRGILGSSDTLRQTVVDLMQLVRQIETGIDVDGDGTADFDSSRIYYFGQSFGGMYGTIFLGVESNVRVGAPNVPGGPVIDIVRLSPGFRFSILTPALAARIPSLINAPPIVGPGGVLLPQVNENLPLRDLPAVINDVPGAIALQDYFDRNEWASQPGNPVAYAPHLRKAPLDGVPAKSVLYQIAKGDQTVPNPTASAIIRAGDIADRLTYMRNDVAFAINPATPKNPHTFLTNVAAGGLAPAIAIGAQTQIATFFASDGTAIIDPDGTGPLFEVPIAGPLPEELNFIP